jgi:hypothetical protein
MTVEEILKCVICNVEVWKPIKGVKIWNFDRHCIEEVDLNEYIEAEVRDYKFMTKEKYLEDLADTYFDEELYMANYGNEPVLVIMIKPE